MVTLHSCIYVPKLLLISANDNELDVFLKKTKQNVIVETVNWYMLCESDLLLAVYFLEEFTIGKKTNRKCFLRD